MMFQLSCKQVKFSNLLASSEVEVLVKFTKHPMFKIRPGQKIEMPLCMFHAAFEQMYSQLVYEATQYSRYDGKLAVHEAITRLLQFADAITPNICSDHSMVWEAVQ